MADFLPDDLIHELEGMAIRTTQGSFVRMEDARRLIEKRRPDPDRPVLPEHLQLHEARALAREHLRLEGMGAQGPQEAGKAIPASEPQPSSRT